MQGAQRVVEGYLRRSAGRRRLPRGLEVDIARSLPYFCGGGAPDNAVKEAKDRVQAPSEIPGTLPSAADPGELGPCRREEGGRGFRSSDGGRHSATDTRSGSEGSTTS